MMEQCVLALARDALDGPFAVINEAGGIRGVNRAAQIIERGREFVRKQVPTRTSYLIGTQLLKRRSDWLAARAW